MKEHSSHFSPPRQSATQSVGRALDLLKIIANAGTGGSRLVDVVMASGLSKPTVHRLLAELVGAGLLMKDARRRYQLGRFAFELGVVASAHFRVQDLCRDAVLALARQSGSTVYLGVRSGCDVFCVDSASWTAQPWARTYAKGSRVTLGAGACGLAIFSFLPTDERAQLLVQNAARLPRYGGLKASEVAGRVEATRDHGYAATESDVVSGVAALGVPLLDRVGRPMAALSVAMPSQRMTESSRRSLVSGLREHTLALREVLLRHDVSCIA